MLWKGTAQVSTPLGVTFSVSCIFPTVGNGLWFGPNQPLPAWGIQGGGDRIWRTVGKGLGWDPLEKEMSVGPWLCVETRGGAGEGYRLQSCQPLGWKVGDPWDQVGVSEAEQRWSWERFWTEVLTTGLWDPGGGARSLWVGPTNPGGGIDSETLGTGLGIKKWVCRILGT